MAIGGYQTPTITQQDLQGLGICSSPSGLFGGFRRLVTIKLMAIYGHGSWANHDEH